MKHDCVEPTKQIKEIPSIVGLSPSSRNRNSCCWRNLNLLFLDVPNNIQEQLHSHTDVKFNIQEYFNRWHYHQREGFAYCCSCGSRQLHWFQWLHWQI